MWGDMGYQGKDLKDHIKREYDIEIEIVKRPPSRFWVHKDTPPELLPKVEPGFKVQPRSFLKSMKGIHSKNEKKLRIFVEAVWYMAKSGCQWRLLPKIYGNYRSIHRRFKKWCEKKIWEKLLKYTQEPDLEVHIIDGTIVRAHACSAGYKKNSANQEALGRSKGGFTTKIHATVDALGNPLKFVLTPGQRNEITQAETLTENIVNSIVVADKGYDSNSFVASLENRKCKAVIPPKRNRKVQRNYDKHLYKERHLIECFFGKIKNFRRIFSRFDKTAEVFMGFLNFVGSLIWLL
ncbi:putative transposase for insertion sequence element IS6501 [Trichonephila clavata]|uniref:Putative transposase for insertion sequence element IS6501 n=2 Tax=Trichonephila clavata TaxID=2740835 RepID=A0A8X6GZL3_TRICU|nr:putative transposase for insertion sequence element IS6501 [Trichonephila clavata]